LKVPRGPLSVRDPEVLVDTVEQVERRPWVLRRWPAVAGAAMAGFAAWWMDTGADVAPIVTASGFVYLGAAALQRRKAAWPVFAVSFVAVGLGWFVQGQGRWGWIRVPHVFVARFEQAGQHLGGRREP